MSKGKKNGYTCQKCGGRIITIDIDDGVTPFAIACRVTEDCDGLMYSAFYSIPQSLPAQYEWFKPESLKGYHPAMKEHFRKGGLDLRPIEDKGEIEENRIPALWKRREKRNKRKKQHKRKRKSFRSYRDWNR